MGAADASRDIPGFSIELPKRGQYRDRKNRTQMDAEAVMAFERRAMGFTTFQIAEELDISVSTVIDRIERARELIVAPTIEQARELSVRTLEAAKTKLLTDWGELVEMSADKDNARGNGKREHSPAFAQALVKIEDRLAKLQGADRPVVVQMNVKLEHTGSVDDELNALAAELGLNDPSPETSGDGSPGDEPAEAGAEVTT